jgi:anti-sigma regulatory factor (Ser/Thr protein kinase)
MLVSGLAIPGRPEHVQAARQFTDLVLRAHAREDDGVASLLVSELVTNSVRHSRSGGANGTVAILVAVSPGEVLIGVTDDGGADVPVPQPAGEDDGDAESGRGLRLVDQLAARWGHYRQGGQLTTWFQLQAGQPS